MAKSERGKNLGTDFSVGDAIKRKKARMRQLEEAASGRPNEIDVQNDVLDQGDEPDSVRRIFED